MSDRSPVEEFIDQEFVVDQTNVSVNEKLRRKLNPLRWPLRYLVGLFFVALLFVMPIFGLLEIGIDILVISSFTPLFILMVWAMTWDFVSGYTGQISLGHAAFFAIGGYTSGALNVHLGVDPLLTIPLGGLIAAAAGLLIGLPALRLEGSYLSLVTLVAPILMFNFIQFFSDIFGGIPGMNPPDLLIRTQSFELQIVIYYYLAYLLMLAVFVLFHRMTRSEFGDVMTAMREDKKVLSYTGFSVPRYKLFVFTLSAAIGGLAAAIFVHTPQASPQPRALLGGPSTLGLEISLNVILITVIGGVGTIIGAVVGTVIFVFLQAIFAGVAVSVPGLGVTVADLSQFFVLAVVFMVLTRNPEGFVPIFIRAGNRIRNHVLSDDDTD
jgi:branched-chain amino acid transport system permease protein